MAIPATVVQNQQPKPKTTPIETGHIRNHIPTSNNKTEITKKAIASPTNRNSFKIEFLGLVVAMPAAKCDWTSTTNFMRLTSM